jgi:multisubunit Na+/H+ antiporter MnhB subunit
MSSLILRTIATWLLPVLVMGSFFLLLRGHNAPGGGFAGGLLASAGYVLMAIAFVPRPACGTLRIPPHLLLGVGLGVALLGALVSVVVGKPPMTGLWLTLSLPRVGEIHLGTPLLFDFGVYLLVVGAVTTFILTLAEAQRQWKSS